MYGFTGAIYLTYVFVCTIEKNRNVSDKGME